jgi:hypothetical protein
VIVSELKPVANRCANRGCVALDSLEPPHCTYPVSTVFTLSLQRSRVMLAMPSEPLMMKSRFRWYGLLPLSSSGFAKTGTGRACRQIAPWRQCFAHRSRSDQNRQSQILRGLLSMRRGNSWSSTQATAYTAQALSKYEAQHPETEVTCDTPEHYATIAPAKLVVRAR